MYFKFLPLLSVFSHLGLSHFPVYLWVSPAVAGSAGGGSGCSSATTVVWEGRRPLNTDVFPSRLHGTT